MIKRYDPYRDPDAYPCPQGCGRLTDDPYGGPCTACWDAIANYDQIDDDWGTDTP